MFGWFVLLGDEYKQLGKHIAAGAGFVSNFTLWSEAGYFDNAAETKPLLHLWSLGVEEQFYIVWPILLWVAWRRRVNLFAITLLVASVSFYLNLKGIDNDRVATFYSPQTRFWELLSGGLLAWTALNKKVPFAARSRNLVGRLPFRMLREHCGADARIPSHILSLLGLFFLVYGIWRINKDLGFPGKWAVVPVLGAVLIISSGPDAWVNRRILSSKIAVWFGLLSYPIYLWHWPLLSFARIVESGTPDLSIRIAAVFLSVAFAWLTYVLVERPIRLQRNGRTKCVALVVLMSLAGYAGYNVNIHNGYELRSAIRNLANNKNELVRTSATDKECPEYVGRQRPVFPYCRFSNAGSNETVAVVGDSHAHVAYTGIAEYLKNRGINTILLANSSCPPLLGVPIFGSTDRDKQVCNARINDLIDVLLAHRDIKKVFLITRGTIYFTGTEPLSGNRDVMHGKAVSTAEFKSGTQRTIDRLVSGGKKVFLVTENPELSFTAESCLVRPLRLTVRDCRPFKKDVLKRQATYLEAIKSLRNVSVIYSLNAFCPSDRCFTFHDGKLLYADDDHLSVAGSIFQVEEVLRDYLN